MQASDFASYTQGLHRLVKGLLDSGRAASDEEGYRVLAGYRLAIHVGPEAKTSRTMQAALLTAVNVASRSMLGGVSVVGCLDTPLLAPIPGGPSLGDAVIYYGGHTADRADGNIPAIVMGSVPALPPQDAPVIRATFDGWCAGVAPLSDGFRLDEAREFAPGGVLAGALAVSEAFQFYWGTNGAAMRRRLGLSLWQPDVRDHWWEAQGPGVQHTYLPGKLWLIGLGHLGQAYLWTLMSLPYRDPGQFSLVLQDFDTLCEANLSTSILTRPEYRGEKKARRMARLCEERGFRAVIVERPFDGRFQIGPHDPQIALCGTHDAASRMALEAPGFAEVIEAGLGHGVEEFLTFQMHTLPGSKSPQELWQPGAEQAPLHMLAQPGYRELGQRGMDQCGLVQVAGCAVGAPFVGAAVAAIVVCEAIRAVMNGHRYEVIDGSLSDPSRRVAVARPLPLTARNLGFVRPDY